MAHDAPSPGDADSGWPPVDYEELPWRSRYADLLSERQRRSLPQTYRSALVPRIASLTPTLTPSVASEEARAIADIAAFSAASRTLRLPLTTLLLRSESNASSRIERLTCSARALVEEEALGEGHGNAVAIVAAVHALVQAVDTTNDVTIESLLGVHRTLMEETAPDIAGRIRAEPVWIGGADLAPVGAVFVPPAPGHLRDALDDLISFIVRDDLTPLVKTAVAHAHFETIHPFADGNGRVGRALIHVILTRSGLLHGSPLPLSAVLLTRIDEYFDALDAYRKGCPVAIIRLFIDAARVASQIGVEAGTALDVLGEELVTRVTARRGTPDRDLVVALLSQPVMDVKLAARTLSISDQSARRAFDRLEAIGIVRSYQISRGRRAWRAPDVLDLMDEVAVGMGRRQLG